MKFSKKQKLNTIHCREHNTRPLAGHANFVAFFLITAIIAVTIAGREARGVRREISSRMPQVSSLPLKSSLEPPSTAGSVPALAAGLIEDHASITTIHDDARSIDAGGDMNDHMIAAPRVNDSIAAETIMPQRHVNKTAKGADAVGGLKKLTSPPPSNDGGCSAGALAVFFDLHYPGEYPVIAAAAERNGCDGDDFLILLAVRFAENGSTGLEFGVLHPRAINTDLDTQAGWAAATIVKNRLRYIRTVANELRSGLEVTSAPGGVESTTAGASGGFLDFLADRYCPASVDPVGHANWRVNVGYWYTRLASQL